MTTLGLHPEHEQHVQLVITHTMRGAEYTLRCPACGMYRVLPPPTHHFPATTEGDDAA